MKIFSLTAGTRRVRPPRGRRTPAGARSRLKKSKSALSMMRSSSGSRNPADFWPFPSSCPATINWPNLKQIAI